MALAFTRTIDFRKPLLYAGTMSTATQTSPLLGHLTELRSRLIKVVLSWIVFSGVCLFFAKEIYTLLTAPLQQALPEGSYFIATHPIEAWVTYIKVSLLTGFFAALPVIFYQVWRFVAPGLLKKEKRFSSLVVVLLSLCFLGGALFGYFWVFPLGFSYLMGFLQDTPIHILPQMKEAFSFIAKLLVAFGLIFELPLLVFFVASQEIVSFKTLMGFQKYLIIIALIISAILTPPDIITQALMSLPIILLYQVGLGAAWLTRKRS